MLSRISSLDNIYKDDLINFIEMVKTDVLPTIISKVDNEFWMIFLNWMLTFAWLLQSKINQTKKQETIKPNNGLSKK